ncbi:MAG: sigma-70 family RNA polymerase sigma factor [Clostridiales Family XIII bacterium]|jgi:RNA polymerase sigma-70 factor (ECF subfamily)|nr:sigma-70 family RNA polymerase sigma factor [Clostridiales Family XIII bacterium]
MENGAGQLFDLIIKASGGDEQAFEELYRLKLRTILFHVSRWIKNPEDVNDVAQDVCIQMYKGISKLKSPEAFNAWLQRIVTNECYRFTHKNRHKAGQANIDDYVDTIQEENKEFLPKESLESEELRRVLLDAINSLPPKRKRAIIMYYYDDMSQKEIAYALGISLKTVSTNILRAKKMLKEELEKNMDSKSEKGAASSSTVLGELLASSAAALYPEASLDIAAKTIMTPVIKSAAGTAGALKVAAGAYKTATIWSKIGAAIGAKGVAVIASGVFVVGGIGITASVIHTDEGAENSRPTAAVSAEQSDTQATSTVGPDAASMKINFASGECECGHLNPKEATLEGVPEGDWQITWKIAAATGGDIISEGEGLDVTTVLAELYDKRKDGLYKLTFRYANAEHAYNLDRDFAIDTGEITPGEYL